MDIVLTLHSIVRFLVLAIALAGIVVSLLNLAQRSALARPGQILASAFVGMYDLQVLLGLLIILLGGLSNALHPVVMFVGVLVAHGIQSMSKRSGENASPLARLALFVVPLLIILVGLALIGRLPV